MSELVVGCVVFCPPWKWHLHIQNKVLAPNYFFFFASLTENFSESFCVISTTDGTQSY